MQSYRKHVCFSAVMHICHKDFVLHHTLCDVSKRGMSLFGIFNNLFHADRKWAEKKWDLSNNTIILTSWYHASICYAGQSTAARHTNLLSNPPNSPVDGRGHEELTHATRTWPQVKGSGCFKGQRDCGVEPRWTAAKHAERTETHHLQRRYRRTTGDSDQEPSQFFCIFWETVERSVTLNCIRGLKD